MTIACVWLPGQRELMPRAQAYHKLEAVAAGHQFSSLDSPRHVAPGRKVGMALPLANLFFVSLNIGGPGVKFLILTFQIGDKPAISYDLLQLLLILGISIVAAVLLERLLWRGTPGGLLGAFLISLIGIGLFLALIPLVWKGDYYIDGIPLMTAIIGAVFSLLVVHLLFGFWRHDGVRRRPVSSS